MIENSPIRILAHSVWKYWDILETLYETEEEYYLSSLSKKLGKNPPDVFSYINELESSKVVATYKKSGKRRINLTHKGQEIVRFYTQLAGLNVSASDNIGKIKDIAEMLLSEDYSDEDKEDLSDLLLQNIGVTTPIEDFPLLLELFKKTIEGRGEYRSSGYRKKILSSFHISMKRIFETSQLTEWFMTELYDTIFKQATKSMDEKSKSNVFYELEQVYLNIPGKKEDIYRLFKNFYFSEDISENSQLFGYLREIMCRMVRSNSKYKDEFKDLMKKNNPDKKRERSKKVIKSVFSSEEGLIEL